MDIQKEHFRQREQQMRRSCDGSYPWNAPGTARRGQYGQSKVRRQEKYKEMWKSIKWGLLGQYRLCLFI